MTLKLAQSGVDEHFRMLVPVYLELADAAVTLLGRARMTGNNNTDQKVALKGLKTKPRKAILNYCDDLLASPN